MRPCEPQNLSLSLICCRHSMPQSTGGTCPPAQSFSSDWGDLQQLRPRLWIVCYSIIFPGFPSTHKRCFLPLSRVLEGWLIRTEGLHERSVQQKQGLFLTVWIIQSFSSGVLQQEYWGGNEHYRSVKANRPMTSVHFSHQHQCLLYCVSHQNVNGVNCSQNLKHLLKTNLYLTAWCLIDCDGVARYLDVMFTGQTEEKEGRETNTGRSFKPIKENQMIQTLNCIKQCDTATCFLPSAGTIETFYTTVIFLWSCEPFSDVRGARCSAAVWGELCLHPLNCSDGHRRTNGRSRRVQRSAMCVKPLTRACSHTHT